ncbi:MAG: hypothetical protein V9F00_18835 [Nocardioides sp.]
MTSIDPTHSLPFDHANPEDSGESPDIPLPRVLFVSVNPFSDTSNNGKTFASFFKGYPRDSLAQLYFHREIPSSEVCENYYRITDEDILSNLLRPWRATGERVTSLASATSPIPTQAHTVLKGSQTARLLRQALWTQVRVQNEQLLDWLDAFAPEIIFFCGGDAAALYPKVTALRDRYGARMAFYITDDYVLPLATKNLAVRVMRSWTRQVFQDVTSNADIVLTIGEHMSRAYKREFGFDSIPLMNMVELPPAMPPPTVRKSDRTLTLLYAGSTHSNRWKILSQIADSIERLAGGGVSARLLIYGPNPDAEALTAVDRPPFSEYRGLLSPNEINAAISKADVLVHVESDDPASIAATTLSVSTKIPEYLASGRSILAIGPRGLASIEYLAQHGAALLVEPRHPEGLDNAIDALAGSPGIRFELSMRGFELASTNHDGLKTRRSLWHRLQRLVA